MSIIIWITDQDDKELETETLRWAGTKLLSRSSYFVSSNGGLIWQPFKNELLDETDKVNEFFFDTVQDAINYFEHLIRYNSPR